MSIRRTAVVPGLVALALAGSLLGASAPAFAAATPAAASAAASSPAAGPKSDGAHGICLRATRVEARITRDLARLNGPVTEVGSVARLAKRVQDAQSAGHTAIQKYLQDRLTYRQSLLPTLQQRQSDLVSVNAWCAANGNGKGQ
jgi:hypothetical protein